MRLLEPLNGIKVGQGHYIIHLYFFIAMSFIKVDRQFDDSLMTTARIYQSDTQLFDNTWTQDLTFEDTLQMSGHGEAAGESTMTKEEHEAKKQAAIDYEIKVFKFLKWQHLTSFVVILIGFELKRRGWYIIGQGLQSIWVTFSLFMFSYVIYIVKMNYGSWNYDMSYVRAWLLIEVVFFFNWILSGIIFLIIGKIITLNPMSIDEDELENDNDVWNDRKTQDFMVHLKAEFFQFTYVCSLLIQTIVIGFTNFYFIYVFGKRDWNPTLSLFLIMVLHRTYILMVLLWDYHQKKHPANSATLLKYGIRIGISLLVSAGVIYMFISSNRLEGQNIYCQVWAFTNCIILVIEPIFVTLQILFNRKYSALIKIDDLFQAADENQIKDGVSKEDKLTNFNSQNQDGEQFQSQSTLNKSIAQQKLEKKLSSKRSFDYSEDFIALTVLCYLKQNIQKYKIVPEKRAQMLFSALSVQLIVVLMLICMMTSIVTNEQNRYANHFSHSFAVFYIKIPCALALHLVLYPEVAKGINVMKFTNQQAELFEGNGAAIGFILGLVQVLSVIFCEIVNIYLLTYQHTVEHCIIHFVALEIIIEVSKLYLESLQGNALKQILHHPPKRVNDGKNIVFANRTCFHKCARIIYKFVRTFYVGVVFYFVPFATLYWQWVTFLPGEAGLDIANHEHGGGHH